MGFKIRSKGNYNKTEKFLKKARKLNVRPILEKYGRAGVDALASATPIESGQTAYSWGYEIHSSGASHMVYWTNSHINDGVVIALILQLGHGTGGGGWVEGRDYINPALRPIMDEIAEAAWKEVVGA